MKQYIDKSDVVAEIKERIDRDNEKAASFSSNSEHDYLYRVKETVYKDLLSFLDTLKVKEVDLEKELDRYTNSAEYVYNETRDSYFLVAKHFFELGLKAQKGE